MPILILREKFSYVLINTYIHITLVETSNNLFIIGY